MMSALLKRVNVKVLMVFFMLNLVENVYKPQWEEYSLSKYKAIQLRVSLSIRASALFNSQ